GAGSPTYKVQQATKLSREAIRSAFGRVQASLGEFVLERDATGRLHATAAGQNVGRISAIARSIIEVARAQAKDQRKLEKFMLSAKTEIERRHATGQFDFEDSGGERPLLIQRGEGEVGLSSANGGYVG